MSLSRSLAFMLTGVALFLQVPEAGAQEKRAKQRFQDTTTVTVVEVPVTVSDKGTPIRGLTAANFEVFDGRKKVEILDFEVVDLARAAGDQETAVPVAARRYFLAFFDLSFSDPNSIKKAQEAAADVVLSRLHPTDLAAVATYSRTKGPQLVLPFTSDRSQLRYAIESLGLVASERTSRDPLGLIVKDIESSSVNESSENGGSSGGFAGELESQIRELQNLSARNQKGEEVSTIAQTMDGLATMGQMLAAVDGRKYVLYLSEGFDGEMLFGTESIEAMQEIALASEEGRTQDIDNDTRFGNSDARRVVDRTLEVMRRADASIEAIDIGGLVAGGRNSNLDSLRYMAKQTGGETFANFNNLGSAMEQMLDKTSVTYLISFAPPDLEPDGVYHELKIRTKGVPRGADVTHRAGFFAPKPYDQQNGLERKLKIAQNLVGGERGGGAIGVNAVSAGFPVAGANSYVPVLIEINGSDLLRDFSEATIPIEIYAYALDEEGTIKDYFARSLGLNRQQAGPALEKTGVKYWGHFDLDPGQYTFRVLARNPANGVYGVDVDTVTVPGGEAAGSGLAVLFPEAPGRWILLREEEKEQRQGVDYPFIQNGNPYIPAALPVVSGSAEIALVTYGLGEGTLSAEAQVLTPDGKPVDNGKVELEKGATASNGAATVNGRFLAKGMASGEYLLVVTLKNLANGREVRSTVPVTVG